MTIKEIDGNVFGEFASNHMLKNYFQTKEYGDLMKYSDFSVMYIGAFQNNILIAASLILHKSIGTGMRYGYAPRGFLVDYYDTDLLSEFTKKVKDFFFKRGFAFIKINPEITYSTINFDEKSKTISSRNKKLIDQLKNLGYDKLKDNLYFESLLPKYTPIINLQSYDKNVLDKNMLDNMKKYELSGVKIVRGGENDLETFYKFVDDKETKTLTYYKYFYNTFVKSNMVDLLLIEVNYDTYVKYLQKEYIFEQEKNEKINIEFHDNPNNADIYNRKMKSDQIMARISSDIATANNRMKDNDIKEIIGGAFIVKYQGRITIIMTGNNSEFTGIDVKTYLYYKIIEEYKKARYLYLDLNGITADFSETNPYKELNKFKLKYKPQVYEYIGELDLIVNKPFHQLLWSTNKIQKEFYKPAIKK